MRKSLVAVIAGSAALAGCQAQGEDSGATVSRSYQVGAFQQVEVAGPYDVEVRTGNSPGVSARGPERLLEHTEVTVEGNRLVIRGRHSSGWFHFGWGMHGSAHFVVTVPQLSAASLIGSGDMRVDKVQGQSFDGNVAGSGDLSITTLEVQSLKLAIAGSGDIKAGTGRAQSAEYDVAGSGDLDAGGIDSPAIKASTVGSGGIKAHGGGTASVDIMGSGDVTVTGGAKCTVSKAGSGDARCS